MSLVIGRIAEGSIAIIGDTKLVYDESEFPSKQSGHPSDGLIKSVVVNENLCISFAGNVEKAERVIKEIPASSDARTALTTLSKHATRSNNVEFLVAAFDTKLKLFEIKEGHILEGDSGWIGSRQAFNCFQSIFLGEAGSAEQNLRSFMKIERSLGNSTLTKASRSFDTVIDDALIPEVDGFKVMVVRESSAFRFQPYVHSYRGQMVIKTVAKPGTHIIPINHPEASEGGYNVNFFRSIASQDRIALHIRQGPVGILYQREGMGLLRPQLFQLDEVDFSEFMETNFQIAPSMTSQDPVAKHMADVEELFKKSDFARALISADKALVAEKEAKSAHIHFTKGLILLSLKRINEAVLEMQKAINLDASFQSKATRAIQSLRR